MTAAVQDAGATWEVLSTVGKVLDCGSHLPLSKFPLATLSTRHQPASMLERRPPWPHAPQHQLSVRGTYFLTASTYLKAHYFRGKERLRVLHRGLLTVARDFGWHLEA